MRKDAQAVLLLLIGGTLLKISIAGTFVRYVKPGALPLLLIAGTVLLGLGCVSLWQVIRDPQQALAPERPGGSHTASAQNDSYSGIHKGRIHTGRGRASESRGRGEDGRGQDTGVVELESPVPVQTERAGQDGASDEDDAHVHAHAEPRVGWLLLAPALALLLFAPPALGSYQASRNGTALATQQDSDFSPLPAGDPVRISMLDYAGRAVFDDGKSLAGRRLMLSGFIIAGPGGQPYLARMIVSCCAADARPVKVGLTGDVPSTLKPDEWIEIEGTYVDKADKDAVNGELVPYIQVASLHDIAAPDRQYES